MNKKVLILVLSCDMPPYSNMIVTSRNTWDRPEVEGVETIFYTSQRDNPNWCNTDKVMYFDTGNGLYDMGYKNLKMFEWALENKEFDYVCRVNASCYVNKKNLLEYVQTLPDDNVFCGAEVTDESGKEERWFWGGCSFLFSRDIIQKIVDHKNEYRHDLMEDRAISDLINKFDIPIIPAKSSTIDNLGHCWRLMIYGGGESFEFTDFADINKATGQFLFRVKQDQKRWIDEFIMHRLYEILQ